jgi:hypothetical protein
MIFKLAEAISLFAKKIDILTIPAVMVLAVIFEKSVRTHEKF